MRSAVVDRKGPLRRTLMRSPVVKSQTYPVSGFLRFSPLF
jgi:hypothetical protein